MQESILVIDTGPVIYCANTSGVSFSYPDLQSFDRTAQAIVSHCALLYPGLDHQLILEEPFDQALLAYFQELGLSIPELHVVDCDISQASACEQERIAQIFKCFPEHEIDAYIIDESISTLAQRTGHTLKNSSQVIRQANDKYWLTQTVRACELPSFDTHLVYSHEDILYALYDLKKKGYALATIRLRFGYGGKGAYIDAIDTWVKQFTAVSIPQDGLLVQGWLDGSFAQVRVVGSPSFFVLLDSTGVQIVGASEQVFAGQAMHSGNTYPSQLLTADPAIMHEAERQINAIGTQLIANGYKGYMGVDVHVVDRSGDMHVYVCDINGRLIAATPAIVLNGHFSQFRNHWFSYKTVFQKPIASEQLLALLRTAGLLFDAQCSTGIMPILFTHNAAGLVIGGRFVVYHQTAHGVRLLLDSFRGLFAPG